MGKNERIGIKLINDCESLLYSQWSLLVDGDGSDDHCMNYKHRCCLHFII